MTTGNLVRDEMILREIEYLRQQNTERTLAAVAARLPDGFDLDATELRGLLGADDEVIFEGDPIKADPISGMTVAPKPLEKIEAPRANENEQPSNPPAKATPQPILSFDEAVIATRTALRNINELRLVANLAARKTAEARRELQRAIDAWTAGCGAPMTQLEAARQYAASSQALRAARAAAGLSGTSPSSKAFVRKRMQNGGNMRGAFPSSWKGRTDPRYVPPGPKDA